MCGWFVCAGACVCVCAWALRGGRTGGVGGGNEFKRLFQVPYSLFMLALLHFSFYEHDERRIEMYVDDSCM